MQFSVAVTLQKLDVLDLLIVLLVAADHHLNTARDGPKQTAVPK